MIETELVKALKSVLLSVLGIMEEAKRARNDQIELECYRTIDQIKKLMREIE